MIFSLSALHNNSLSRTARLPPRLSFILFDPLLEPLSLLPTLLLFLLPFLLIFLLALLLPLLFLRSPFILRKFKVYSFIYVLLFPWLFCTCTCTCACTCACNCNASCLPRKFILRTLIPTRLPPAFPSSRNDTISLCLCLSFTSSLFFSSSSVEKCGTTLNIFWGFKNTATAVGHEEARNGSCDDGKGDGLHLGVELRIKTHAADAKIGAASFKPLVKIGAGAVKLVQCYVEVLCAHEPFLYARMCTGSDDRVV